MRIAILHYSKPPVIGGVERVIGEQAAALRQSGHQVRLWSAEEAAAFRESEAWDVVIVHNVFTMPFNLAWTLELMDLAETRTRTHWINWVHDVRWTERVPHATHVAVSKHRQQEYARHTREPVHIIPNGVDAAKVLGLTSRIQELQLENHEGIILLQPTRFVRRKNIELGLQVLAELPDALYLVTAAPDPHQQDGVAYFGELKKLAIDLGVARRVLFLGEENVLSDDDVRGLYQMADALFFPSSQEGFGLPLIEAALHGLPVCCSGIPAHQEVAFHASFFELTASPSGIAQKVKSDVSITQRFERRRLMNRLGWQRITQDLLEPLLSRPAST